METETAEAVWALHLTLQEIPKESLTDDQRLARKRISGAARRLFPDQWQRHYGRQFYARNREREIARTEAKYKAHPDRLRRKRQRWSQRHRADVLARQKGRRQNPDRNRSPNREVGRRAEAKYRDGNRASLAAKARARYQASSATCHPERHVTARGLCASCYRLIQQAPVHD